MMIEILLIAVVLDLSEAVSIGAATRQQLPVLSSANRSYVVVVGDNIRLECQVGYTTRDKQCIDMYFRC